MSRIEELEKRLAADPNSRMFVQLAEEYRKAGMLEQAIHVCEQGLKKHPQYPSARVALGRALLEAEHFDRASAEFESVLKQVPDNILANKFLGETYHRLGRHDEALKKYRVAHSLAPEDTELDERIAEVQAVLVGRGAPVASPAPAPARAPSAPPAPPPQAAPAPKPAAPTAPAAPPPAVGTSRPVDDLAPIPLVDVDEPMVLEDRNYAPPPRPAEPPKAASPAPPPRPAAPPRTAAPPVEAPAPRRADPRVLEPTLAEPPKRPKAPPPPAPQTPVAEIETPTMAEIYASQGHFDRAVAVYQRILQRQPNDAALRARLEELQMLSNATAGAKTSAPPKASPSVGGGANARTIRVLEQWLEAIQRSRGA
jgi:tetratricopeptide (TPR) repeat protein